MYPETDIAPFQISGINVPKPETLDEREKNLPLNDEESKQLVNRELDEKFNDLNDKYEIPKLISRILLHTLPQLKDEGENISMGDLEIVLDLFKDGVLVKEGIPYALIQSSNNEEIKINSGNIDDEVSEFIDELIKEILITSAPSLLAASSNETLVRVEFSKKTFNTTYPDRYLVSVCLSKFAK